MPEQQLELWLRLLITPTIGVITARKLLQAFGLPASIFSQSYASLIQVVSAAQAKQLLQLPPLFEQQLELTQAWLQQRSDRYVLTLADSNYPPALLTIADPPILLFLQGQLLLATAVKLPALAVVGSRLPTPQGKQNAFAFAKYFAQQGITVVSGLALGVDAAAHQGALAASGSSQLATIAVVGTGLDKVYPKQHDALAQQISQRGLLISEFAVGTAPLAHNFPKRNRLIAALSAGVLVIEASLKSGSLITAKQALEQGKEVFAIPGSIHAPQAAGTNFLIKQGAKLVATAADVFEELPADWLPSAAPRPSSPDTATAAVNSKLVLLLDRIGYEPISIEQLCLITQLSSFELQAGLLELELLGKVARLDGGRYQRLVK